LVCFDRSCRRPYSAYLRGLVAMDSVAEHVDSRPFDAHHTPGRTRNCLLMPRRIQQQHQRTEQIPIGVIRCFDAESSHLALQPHFPTSVQCLAGDNRRVQYANHERADSPLKLGNTLDYRPSPPCVLKELCVSFSRFTAIFPY
jgi:hypothetical protein